LGWLVEQAHSSGLFGEYAAALGRDEHRARTLQTPWPAPLHTVRAERRPAEAAKMQAPLAPVETRTTKQPPCSRRTSDLQDIGIDADLSQEGDTGLGDNTSIAGQLDIPALAQGLGEGDAQPPREMVVAGAGSAQREIAGPDAQAPPIRRQLGGNLHDAFEHARYGNGGELIVAMAALLADLDKPDDRHALQVTTGRLRRNARHPCQLGCRKCAAVHQRVQHAGA